MNKKIKFLLLLITFYISITSNLNSNTITNNNINENYVVNKIYFASDLFNGNFSKNKNYFNDKYLISYKDKIKIDVWGEINFSSVLTVDLKGNILIPKIGVIKAQGYNSTQLQNIIVKKLKSFYKKNVSAYINIKSYEKINIIVAGNVKNNGTYSGYPNDLLLNYIDMAGGISNNGDYRNIIIKRNNKIIKIFDLYDFKINGNINFFQFKNGDIIFIPLNKKHITIKTPNNEIIYQIKKNEVLTKNIISILPNNEYTNFIIEHKNNKTDYKINQENNNIKLFNKDTITFYKNKNINNYIITIINNLNNTERNIIINKNTSFKEIKNILKINNINYKNISIYRKEIAKKQKENINRELDYLERLISHNTSSNLEEEQIRSSEQKRMQIFINKARNVKTKGQIVISSNYELLNLKLKNEDKIIIFDNEQIASSQGALFFPSTFTISKNTFIKDIIKKSGGLTSNADEENMFLLKQNGEITKIEDIEDDKVENGDTLFILTKKDNKNFLFFKDLTTVLYQIMLSAGVLLRP